MLDPAAGAALCASVTVDLDTTDVEVYRRKKRGVAFNYQGQRVVRPHVAVWAQTTTTLVADLMGSQRDRHPHAPALLTRALRNLPSRARAGKIRLRADAGYVAGDLAVAAHLAGFEFAIGAKRIAPLWRLLSGMDADAWPAAIDMHDTQGRRGGLPPGLVAGEHGLLIRRTKLTADQISTDPRSRRRRTLHPDQRALPLTDLADADAVHAYSFVVSIQASGGPERWSPRPVGL